MARGQIKKQESSGISVGLSRCSRCPIWCADATHTQNLAKSDPATTPAPWTVQWHLKALKSARGLRRNRISPRSFPRDTCDNLRPNRPWRSPRVKNQAIELANSSHWRGRCSHVDSVEKSAYAKHLRTNKDPPLPRSDPHLCPKSHEKTVRVHTDRFLDQIRASSCQGTWRCSKCPGCQTRTT